MPHRSDSKEIELEGSAYLGELLAGVFYSVAGYRMLRLATQTREKPERVLGWTFLLMGTSFVLYQIPMVFLQLEHLSTPFNFAGRLVYCVSSVTLAHFTRIVFRQREAWASVLVFGIAVSLIVGVGFSALGGDWEGFSLSNRWFWFEWAANMLPFGWIGAEAFFHYRSGRRRVRVGLLEPLVCNRFLLWMIVGLLQLSVFLTILVQYVEYEATGIWAAWSDIALGILELATVGAIWLVFFPPAVYCRWIGDAATSPEQTADR
jgi:hypothetical protein